MQNYCKTIGALAAASALVAGTASAEVEYSLSAGYHTEYLFRGVELGDDLIDFGLTASTEIYGLNVKAGAWYGVYDTNASVWFGGPSSVGWETSELDLFAEVSKDLGFATLTAGYVWYINDDTGPSLFGTQLDDAQEAYFGISREFAYGINAALTYYWDIETDNDGFFNLEVSKSFKLTDCVSLGLATSIGYTGEEGDFTNWISKVSVDWAFTDSATLSPYIMYAIDGDADLYEMRNDDTIVVGCSLGVSF